jgi:hypothetical protein
VFGRCSLRTTMRYQYSKRGSSTLLAFGEEHFAVFAEHQRANSSPDRIRIVRGFSSGPSLAVDTFVTVNAVGEEIEDVRALRISREHHSRQNLFDFAPVPERLPPVQSAKMLIAFGTPTAKSEITYDPGHVHVGTPMSDELVFPSSAFWISERVLLQHARALANGQSDAWAMLDGAGEDVLGLGEIVASVEQAVDRPCRRASISRMRKRATRSMLIRLGDQIKNVISTAIDARVLCDSCRL